MILDPIFSQILTKDVIIIHLNLHHNRRFIDKYIYSIIPSYKPAQAKLPVLQIVIKVTFLSFPSFFFKASKMAKAPCFPKLLLAARSSSYNFSANSLIWIQERGRRGEKRGEEGRREGEKILE